MIPGIQRWPGFERICDDRGNNYTWYCRDYTGDNQDARTRRQTLDGLLRARNPALALQPGLGLCRGELYQITMGQRNINAMQAPAG